MAGTWQVTAHPQPGSGLPGLEWGCDRPGFDWLFPFIDRNRDGKIAAEEYETFRGASKVLPRQVLSQNERAWRNGTRGLQENDRSVMRKYVAKY